MRLVEAARQHRVAKVAGLCLGLIRIHAKAAQFNANAPAGIFAQETMEWIVAIGVILMKHEVGAQKLEGCKSIGLEIDDGAQDGGCKLQTGGKVADNQAWPQAFEALAIGISSWRREFTQDACGGLLEF